MVYVRLKKGLDIPVIGGPGGGIKLLREPKQVAYDFRPFCNVKVIVKESQKVSKGESIAFVRGCSEMVFVSPVGGIVREIRRGEKRRLLEIVFEREVSESEVIREPKNPKAMSREEIVETLLASGVFVNIRKRPFNVVADPLEKPRSIFVKCIDTAPFAVPPELQISRMPTAFQIGIDAISKLTDGDVFVVCKKDSDIVSLISNEKVKICTFEGPHPSGNVSVHIHHIDPIRGESDVVWSVTAYDVLVVGYLMATGKYYTDCVISICGEGVKDSCRGYFLATKGCKIGDILKEKTKNSSLKIIAGDILSGRVVDGDDFLGFYEKSISCIPKSDDREFMHFIKEGICKYSFFKAYLSSFCGCDKKFSFSSLMHGEPRAFVEGAIYDKVMPMNIPTAQLVKAVIAKDFEFAKFLGLLEVDGEDFALPAFVCPSKIDMVGIMKRGIEEYYQTFC